MTLPRIEPIRPVRKDAPFADSEWTFEFKYDGFRGLLYLEPENARFISRKQNVLHRFDELATSIAAFLHVRDAIIDGEVIARDATDRPVLRDLLRRQGNPSYIAFDLLWLDGRDLRTEPLATRREMLHELLKQKSRLIEPSFFVDGTGHSLFAFMCEHDLEGVIAKRLRDKYNKRTKWYKIVNPNYSVRTDTRKFFNGIRKRAAR